MAAVRDPAFWKRFSVAVHQDEEQQSSSTSRSRPELKHSKSWLQRQNHKRSRRTCICWIFWLCFFGFIAGIIITVLWLKAAGVFDKVHIGADTNASAATATATSTGTSSASSSTSAAGSAATTSS